jgi:hypothetical protein
MRARTSEETPAAFGDRLTSALAATSASPTALGHPLQGLQQTIGNQAVQRLLGARPAESRAGTRLLQRDFKADFEGKASTPATQNAPAPPGTVRVRTIAGQDGKSEWVNAPYEVYSPGEIPVEHHDPIMESGKAFQWRSQGGTVTDAIRAEADRLANTGELTVGDMLRLSRRASKMNVRIAMAKVGNDFRFVGYDMSQGEEGGAVHSGFVESEAGSTGGVGRALFADRLTRALLNRAPGMYLEVYKEGRTAAFHEQIFTAAGRQGAPTEGTKYRLTTAEMVRIAVAWNDRLTPTQVANLNELVAGGGDISAAEAEAALLRGATVSPRGRGGGGSGGGGGGGGPVEIPISEVTSAGAQAKGAALQMGAQALLAKQISNLQSSEKAKAEARFAELSPEIGRLLDEGYSVTVTVEAEIPKTLNIAGAATSTDPSMVVYYRNMYIDSAIKVPPKKPPGEKEPPAYHAVGEVDEKYGNPRRWEDPHDYTLDQQIRHQMGDSDPLGKEKPNHPTHRVIKRSTTFTPQLVEAIANLKNNPPAAAQPPKPKVDEETARKLAAAPSRVGLLTENVVQYKTAVRVREKLKGNAIFHVSNEEMGGGGRTLTRVVYWSKYDKPRAEQLADLLRAEGLSAARADASGDGSDTPGYLQINFGHDAEK